jgi:hypothetical protein
VTVTAAAAAPLQVSSRGRQHKLNACNKGASTERRTSTDCCRGAAPPGS